MTCLWLTLADPNPTTNGQFLYSDGLIRALQQAGCKITVIGLSRQESPLRSDPLWKLAECEPQSRWQGLMSRWPYVAMRSRTPGMRRHLAECLSAGQWDAVVFDSIAVGWALPEVLAWRDRQAIRPTLVYLSHNHERMVARQITDWDDRLATKLIKQLDAAKTTWLERELVAEADLVTANTPEDLRSFARERPERPMLHLPPGYSGAKIMQRRITPETPRRAVIVGSFDWLPKRVSLEQFLTVAMPVFAGRKIELQVVGQAEEAYLAGLRTRFPNVVFTGAVADVIAPMAQARMALVPDLLGGFKLKGLDYVFNRLPVFTMKGALPGMPLQPGVNMREFTSHAALARGVAEMIDDYDGLNAMQDAAFTACDATFDWAEIGRSLAHGIGLAGRHHRVWLAGRPAMVSQGVA